MVDKLYENMLELTRDSKEQDCDITLCNLNDSDIFEVKHRQDIVI